MQQEKFRVRANKRDFLELFLYTFQALYHRHKRQIIEWVMEVRLFVCWGVGLLEAFQSTVESLIRSFCYLCGLHFVINNDSIPSLSSNCSNCAIIRGPQRNEFLSASNGTIKWWVAGGGEFCLLEKLSRVDTGGTKLAWLCKVEKCKKLTCFDISL